MISQDKIRQIVIYLKESLLCFNPLCPLLVGSPFRLFRDSLSASLNIFCILLPTNTRAECGWDKGEGWGGEEGYTGHIDIGNNSYY